MIAEGRSKGLAEYNEVRANVEAGNPDKPSTHYGYVEEIARWSDFAELRGYLEGLENALLALARELDQRSK